MKLRLEQLTTHLNKGLQPLYLISGDEPLLVHEANQAIQQQAKQLGYQERQQITVDKSFNWQTLLDNANMLSLFSTKKIIELRLQANKPGDKGSKALQRYCEKLPQDTLLLIISNKLDSASQKTLWYKAIDKVGVTLPVWPIEGNQLPTWIKQRLQQVNLSTSQEGLALIAEQTQGNLLAAQQTIEKLRLLYTEGNITTEQIAAMIADSARFDIFQLADCALAGDITQAIRIFNGLLADGSESILILWVLAREIRQLIPMGYSKQQGMPISQVLQQHRVWQKRKPIVQKALERHDKVYLEKLLQCSSEIDGMIKGNRSGNVTDALLQLICGIAGQPLMNNL